jgi:hypothetical protein
MAPGVCVLYPVAFVSMFKADVQRAATLLDQEQPGWAARIDVTRLNLRSPHDCILGQLYAPTPWQRFWGDASGFARGGRLLKLGYRQINLAVFACESMTDLWVEEIAARLFTVEDTEAADQPSDVRATEALA